MSFEDKTLVCRDCGNAFTFTAGEQEFYAQKGFAHEPQRCRDCRQVRKQQRGSFSSDQPATSGNIRSEGYARGNEYGGMRRTNQYEQTNDGNARYDRGNMYHERNDGNSLSGNADYGNSRYDNTGYARQERVQYDTVCAQCGQPTKVPFMPRAGRPVYCQECFVQRRGGAPAERGPRRDSGFNRF